jgi:hypothetical protein
MSNLCHQMEVLVDEIRSATQARLASLGQLRNQTQEDLDRFRRQRQETIRGAQELLRHRLGEIRETTGSLRQATRAALDGIASEVWAARRLWAAGGSAGVSSPSVAAVVAPPSPAEPQEKRAAEREHILRVLRTHPEGIRLVDIGNELGVDWRGLITFTKSLVDEGRIEKIDHLYYSVEDTAD